MGLEDTLFSETEAMAQTGYSRQQLRYLRIGRSDGIYRYKLVLVKSVHWLNIGRALLYTFSGIEFLMKRKQEP